MKIIFFKILIVLLLISCKTQKKINDSTNERVALFNDKKNIEWMVGKNYSESTFLHADFLVIDDVLKVAIQENEFYFLEEKQLSELKKYYLQYLVYLDENGDKWVYINAMCKVSDKLNWKKEMYSIADGGNCYWNMKINITKKTYSYVMINGYA